MLYKSQYQIFWDLNKGCYGYIFDLTLLWGHALLAAWMPITTLKLFYQKRLGMKKQFYILTSKSWLICILCKFFSKTK